MTKLEQFFDLIRTEMGVILATGTMDSITMRLVSPVCYHGSILIFTDANSKKYQQLLSNPNCCVSAGAFFAEAKAEFLGSTMTEKNKELRDVYSEKFPDAFDDGVSFGGKSAEFLLLTPTKLSGWGFKNDVPTEDGVPTIPFEIEV